MAQPYVGEIRMFAGSFAPVGWEFCEGQVIPIDENEVLFNLIGTTYGGDGQSTFALPDLRGRVPVHWGGNGINLAAAGGAEEVTLTAPQVAAHSHGFLANGAQGSDAVATDDVMAGSPAAAMFRAAATPNTAMSALAMGQPVGGSQPHANLQPYLCVDFIIALFGIYPSPS
jgi:microcystin-dependent protein